MAEPIMPMPMYPTVGFSPMAVPPVSVSKRRARAAEALK
eukprot:CAMPEP_0114683236 /NCGR_PEP_ID=MMETSP0191-20121206/57594_1 /TAXON_ID=126664 /ORGANISM="Sorites sp." /LENGTH=38 /DNA_ID= /DNA_START= /DNA_END= /DNA_ORIENTATION=